MESNEIFLTVIGLRIYIYIYIKKALDFKLQSPALKSISHLKHGTT